MNKTYSKAMIELVYEIRRRIESEHKPSIKFANPELLTELVVYYRTCNDTILCALIKELMVYAGESWEYRLHQQDDETISKHIVKTYRGSISLEESPKPSPANISNKPELIYRGQVVKR